MSWTSRTSRPRVWSRHPWRPRWPVCGRTKRATSSTSTTTTSLWNRPSEAQESIDYVHRILKEERDLVIASRPIEATAFEVENTRWTYVLYESGLSINVLYAIDGSGKRAVGFKALRRHGGPGRARLALQVRSPEVEAGRNDPRFVLRDRGRVLDSPKAATGALRLGVDLVSHDPLQGPEAGAHEHEPSTEARPRPALNSCASS